MTAEIKRIPVEETPAEVLKIIQDIEEVLGPVKIIDGFNALLTLTMHAVDLADDDDDRVIMMEGMMEAINTAMKEHDLISQIIIPRGVH